MYLVLAKRIIMNLGLILSLSIASAEISLKSPSCEGDLRILLGASPSPTPLFRVTPRVTLSAERIAEIKAHPWVRAFIAEWKNQIYVNAEQNGLFIKAVKEKDPRVRLALTVMDAVLKEKNDSIFLEKDIPTATVNFFQFLLLGEIKESVVLREAFLGAEIKALYADAKAMRFLFTSDSKEIEQALALAYKKALSNCKRYLDSSPLGELYAGRSGLAGNVATWNLAAVGRTAREADREAREARKLLPLYKDFIPLQDFANNRAFYASQISSIGQARKDLVKRYAKEHPGLLAFVDGDPSKQTLSLPCVELLRRFPPDAPESEISAIFRARFDYVPSTDEQLKMREYFRLAEKWTAEVYVERRIRINLESAKAGAVMMDTSGAGAGNIYETMVGLARSEGQSVNFALDEAERATARVTERMDQSKQAFRDACEAMENKRGGTYNAKNVHFTGDDGAYFPTTPLNTSDELVLTKEMQQRNKGANPRLSFIPPKFLDNESSVLARQLNEWAVLAESIEKKFRLSLEKSSTYAQVEKLVFGMKVLPETNGTLSFELIVSGPVEKNQVEIIEKTFAETIVKFQEKATKQQYRAAKVRYVLGVP